jgi:hypothetical protein
MGPRTAAFIGVAAFAVLVADATRAAAQALPAHWERLAEIEDAYAHMLGRPPSDAELSTWVFYQDVPPGVIDAAHLCRVLRQLLRNSGGEREATARRALRAAGLAETPDAVARAVATLAAEPDGGGYDALAARLAR